MIRVDSAKILALALTAGSITLAIPSPARAQDPVLRPDAARIGAEALRTIPEIWVVRGEGTALPEARTVPIDPPPPELTVGQKAALVAGLGSINASLGPWRVTPGQPWISGKAWLVYSDVQSMAAYADPQNTQGNVSSYAYFSPLGEYEGVHLIFLPPALGRYLVDCRVKKLPPSVSYRVTVYPGEAQQTFANTDHLSLVYEATGLSYAAFDITATGQGYSWGFYGCEITPLK
ncbi:MAG: hypothetical protein ACRELU_14485 [Gemmatimonadota bacterium]